MCLCRVTAVAPAVTVPLIGWNITVRGFNFQPNLTCRVAGQRTPCALQPDGESVAIVVPPSANSTYAQLVARRAVRSLRPHSGIRS